MFAFNVQKTFYGQEPFFLLGEIRCVSLSQGQVHAHKSSDWGFPSCFPLEVVQMFDPSSDRQFIAHTNYSVCK